MERAQQKGRLEGRPSTTIPAGRYSAAMRTSGVSGKHIASTAFHI